MKKCRHVLKKQKQKDENLKEKKEKESGYGCTAGQLPLRRQPSAGGVSRLWSRPLRRLRHQTGDAVARTSPGPLTPSRRRRPSVVPPHRRWPPAAGPDETDALQQVVWKLAQFAHTASSSWRAGRPRRRGTVAP